jgi:hypothetical protein
MFAVQTLSQEMTQAMPQIQQQASDTALQIMQQGNTEGAM